MKNKVKVLEKLLDLTKAFDTVILSIGAKMNALYIW